jgi:hypothetical protein
MVSIVATPCSVPARSSLTLGAHRIVGGVADPEEDVAGLPRPAVVALPRVLPTV